MGALRMTPDIWESRRSPVRKWSSIARRGAIGTSSPSWVDGPLGEDVQRSGGGEAAGRGDGPEAPPAFVVELGSGEAKSAAATSRLSSETAVGTCISQRLTTGHGLSDHRSESLSNSLSAGEGLALKADHDSSLVSMCTGLVAARPPPQHGSAGVYRSRAFRLAVGREIGLFATRFPSRTAPG